MRNTDSEWVVSIQDRVSNEQEEEPNEEDSKATQVDDSSLCKDVAVALVFLARFWVVESIIRFHIFWKQQ